MPTNYFDTSVAIEKHDLILRETGGLPGIMNKELLESVLTHIQNDDYYPTFIDKLAYLITGIAKFHVFNDANKRTALALCGYFLIINGYENRVGIAFEILENVVIRYIRNEFSENVFKEIITYIVWAEPVSEEVMLIIFSSLSEAKNTDKL